MVLGLHVDRTHLEPENQSGLDTKGMGLGRGVDDEILELRAWIFAHITCTRRDTDDNERFRGGGLRLVRVLVGRYYNEK